jgi:hypothetical protein
MEFRLIYNGFLPADNERGKELPLVKHNIRRVFHQQLAELWKREIQALGNMAFTENPKFPKASLDAQVLAEQHKIANRANRIYRFVPLVGERYAISCSLDILFLRRDAPGGLLKHGGDIDNRVGTLFDALRIPTSSELPPDEGPSVTEDPMFCLLEDDKFVTGLTVNTDRLLSPLDPHARDEPHYVMLIVGVKTVVFNPLYAPWKFW